MEQLNFCYIIDDNEEQLRMMKKSIKSIRDCFQKYSPTIYIISLTKKDSKEEKRIYDAVSDSCGDIKCHILRFDINISHIIAFPINTEGRLGYNALSRFFVPYILPCDYVYYVDTDVFFAKDIYNKLIDFDYKITLLRIWKIHYEPVYLATDHVNTGFMYINCRLWRKRKRIFPDILNYFITNQLKIRFPNQDCFTWLVTEKYKDLCIVEDDININNRKVFDGVELVHAVGGQKKNFFEMYDKYYNK